MKSIEVYGNTFDDIQETINEAESNSTITLNESYTGLGKEIIIDKDIIIEGINNATLDAKSTSGIFSIYNSNVILKNLKFINGKSKNGGAVLERGLISCQLLIVNSLTIPLKGMVVQYTHLMHIHQ